MSAVDPPLLQRLRARLDARELELAAEVRAIDDEQAEPLQQPFDPVDDVGEQGEQRIRQAVRSAERERDLHELSAIEAARQRLARGTYGICVDCGQDIPPARLEAEPSAARCRPCQERYEQSPGPGTASPTS